MNAQDFLNTLFSDAVTPERRISLFLMPVRSREFFDSAERAAGYALLRAPHFDIYYGVGLIAGTPRGRGNRSDIAAIAGFVADIDFPSPRRANKPLPTTVEEARKLWSPFGLEPTLLVHSGYGLHAYWLLKEPWVFTSDAERDEAQRLSKGWHGALCREGQKYGWQLENLGDLTRVLRLPGTLNHSVGDQVVEVKILEHHDERRYNPRDFEPFITEDIPEAPVPVTVGALHLDAQAEPPVEKFSKAFESTLFTQTWHRQRDDLTDQSQSAYDLSLASIAALMGWSDQEMADLIIAARRHHNEKPEKALRTDYMARTIARARQNAEAQQAMGEGVDLSHFLAGKDAQGIWSLDELVRQFPALRPPIIEGLLREGETMNVIAASKTGKSFLTVGLALSIAAGRPWFEAFATDPGEVLIIDNELHPNTLAYRIPKVAAALSIPFEEVSRRLYVRCLRGQLKDLKSLGAELSTFEPGRFKVVILDAFYRFLPKDTDENSNGAMAELYNHIDRYAEKLRCAIVVVHHTSKGNQSFKAVTDIGAGAGAQSRATDTHLVLRSHEEPNVVVLEAAVRSFPPVEPRCLRWEFPLWLPAEEFDPADLKQESTCRRRTEPQPPPAADAQPQWTAKALAERLVSATPRATAAILADANDLELSDNRAKNLLTKAEAKGLIYRWRLARGLHGYATVPPPSEATDPTTAEPQKKERIVALLEENPELSSAEVARRCGVSRQYVNSLRQQTLVS